MTQSPPEWVVAPGLVPYAEAVAEMEARAATIRAGTAPERIWLLEHPPLYTAGVSAAPTELLDPDRFPVFETGRGGKHTYHGPGQRVVYVMLDLEARAAKDLHRFVSGLEQWVIAALGSLGLAAERSAGRTGVWTSAGKIAAIGVRVRRWVSYHGVAINLAPDLSHFAGIVPCGLDAPVTSLRALGIEAEMAELDAALRHHLAEFLHGLSERKLNAAFTETAAVLPRLRSA